MPELNALLSFWDALHQCPCGLWTHDLARGWTRHDPDGPAEHSVIRARKGACEVCAWDLSRTPEANLAAMTAKDWDGQVVRGSCFYREGPMWEPFPADVLDLVFERCNLDNCVIPKGARMASVEEAGHPCSNRNLWVQNDGADWVCDKDDRPLEPANMKAHIMEGLNTDPALIPARKLTEEELKLSGQRRDDEKALEAAKVEASLLAAKLGLPNPVTGVVAEEVGG